MFWTCFACDANLDPKQAVACADCRTALYCNISCQREAWENKYHHLFCKDLASRLSPMGREDQDYKQFLRIIPAGFKKDDGYTTVESLYRDLHHILKMAAPNTFLDYPELADIEPDEIVATDTHLLHILLEKFLVKPYDEGADQPLPLEQLWRAYRKLFGPIEGQVAKEFPPLENALLALDVELRGKRARYPNARVEVKEERPRKKPRREVIEEIVAARPELQEIGTTSLMDLPPELLVIIFSNDFSPMELVSHPGIWSTNKVIMGIVDEVLTSLFKQRILAPMRSLILTSADQPIVMWKSSLLTPSRSDFHPPPEQFLDVYAIITYALEISAKLNIFLKDASRFTSGRESWNALANGVWSTIQQFNNHHVRVGLQWEQGNPVEKEIFRAEIYPVGYGWSGKDFNVHDALFSLPERLRKKTRNLPGTTTRRMQYKTDPDNFMIKEEDLEKFVKSAVTFTPETFRCTIQEQTIAHILISPMTGGLHVTCRQNWDRDIGLWEEMEHLGFTSLSGSPEAEEAGEDALHGILKVPMEMAFKIGDRIVFAASETEHAYVLPSINDMLRIFAGDSQ